MKNILLIIALIISTLGWSQEKETTVIPKNEVKINAFNLIAFKFVDITYELLLHEEASVGINVLFNLSDDGEYLDYRTFSLTPYYRQYFSNSFAKGFFIEGFGMLNTRRNDSYDYYDNKTQYYNTILQRKKRNRFCIRNFHRG